LQHTNTEKNNILLYVFANIFRLEGGGSPNYLKTKNRINQMAYPTPKMSM